MKRNKKRIMVAVLAICALAAGGAAFTADVSGSPDTAVAGFHQTAISGAHASSVKWDVSADGQYVSDAVIALANSDDTAQLPAGSVVNAGFDTDGGGTATLVTCVKGAVDGTDANATDYTCTFGTSDPVSQTSVFNVSVTDSTSQVG